MAMVSGIEALVNGNHQAQVHAYVNDIGNRYIHHGSQLVSRYKLDTLSICFSCS
jgi:hypothetical protein